MIDKQLERNDIGRWVIYRDYMGKEFKGRIKGWNDRYVFVVFSCDGNWDRFYDYTAEAVDKNDMLYFIENKENK